MGPGYAVQVCLQMTVGVPLSSVYLSHKVKGERIKACASAAVVQNQTPRKGVLPHLVGGSLIVPCTTQAGPLLTLGPTLAAPSLCWRAAPFSPSQQSLPTNLSRGKSLYHCLLMQGWGTVMPGFLLFQSDYDLATHINDGI